eukprot:gene47133-57726_t
MSTCGQERVWTRMLGTSDKDEGFGVSVDTSTGHAYVTGFTSGAVNGEAYAGGDDIILL